MLNSQESSEPKQITATQENESQEDDSIDPSTFLFLLTQVTPEIVEETPKDSAKSDSVHFINSDAAASKSIPPPLNTELGANLEDNIAVNWINSEYYQAERNSSAAISATEAGQIVQPTELSNSLIPEPSEPSAEDLTLTKAPSALFALGTEAEVKTNEQVHLSTLNVGSELAQVDINQVGLKDLDVLQQEVALVAEDSFAAERTDVLPVALNSSDLSSEEDIKYFESSDFDSENLSQFKTEQGSEFSFSGTESNSPEHSGPVDRSLASHVINNLEAHSAVSPKQLERSSPTSPALSIPLDIDDPQWSTQFSEHVMWLGQQGIKNATIRIHPEDLGPLEISIKVINNSAAVTIISHNQQVRDVIDQSVARLHTMMAEQGLNLSEFNVDSDAGTRQFAQQHEGSAQEEATYLNEIEEDVLFTPVKNKVKPQGVIDYFA